MLPVPTATATARYLQLIYLGFICVFGRVTVGAVISKTNTSAITVVMRLPHSNVISSDLHAGFESKTACNGA